MNPHQSNSNNNRPNTAGKPSRKGGFLRLLMINLAIMAVVGFIIVWGALMWLDSWTSHGEYEIVPNVEGLDYRTALGRLSAEGFVTEVSDSLYDSTSLPGTVLDQNPKQGAKVKHGREVYLTINATTPKMVTLPTVTDVSERQARALLAGVGLTNISVEWVPSEYKNLVMGVKTGSRRLIAGMKIPINTHVIIEVGSGPAETVDSLGDMPTDDEEITNIFDF